MAVDRQRALVLKVGFDTGWFDRDALRCWIEREIDSAEQLSGPLLELTTLEDKPVRVISALLMELAAPFSQASAHRIELAMLGRMVEAERLHFEQAIRRLDWLATEEDGLDENERQELISISDSYDLAMSSGVGTVEEARSQFRAFTARYSNLI